MRLLAVVVSVLACCSFADDKARLTKAGDEARAKNQLPEAEAAYREALTAGDDVDVNASRLAVLSVSLGRCHGGDATVDTLMQVLRGELAVAKPALEAHVKKTPEGCWNTVMHSALVLAYRAEGREADAKRVAEEASSHRCKRLVVDELEDALMQLASSRRDAAAKVLGAQSPLLTSKKPAPCSDALGDSHWKRLGDAGDRAFAQKRFGDAERWYREALTKPKLGDELDSNHERLARTLLAQGKCESGEATTDALIALHRGDVSRASILEARVFALWLDGKVDEARQLEMSLNVPRERRVRPDLLESGLMHLNWAWMRPEVRAKNEKLAVGYLGAAHPLMKLYVAKRDGTKLPAPVACP